MTPNQSSSTPNPTPNLRQSLLGLKFEAQLILYLRYLEQRSYSEIAQILDLSQELVQAKHFQALQDLRLLMHYEPHQQND